MCKIRVVLICVAATGVLSTSHAGTSVPLGTAFTFQGKLQQSGLPLTGIGAVELTFTLFDGPDETAQPVGTPVIIDDAEFIEGLFVVELDFGAAAFDGNSRWLELAVAEPGGAFTPLTPRQQISGVPYALQTRGLFTDELENVGVGSTQPKAKMEVKGSHENGKGQLILVDKDHDSGEEGAGAAMSGWGKNVGSGGSGSGKLWHVGNDEDVEGLGTKKDFKVKNKRDAKLKFGTNDRDEDLVIDKDGKVGLNAPNPKTKLELWGKHESKKGQVMLVDEDYPSFSDFAAVAITGWGQNAGEEEDGKVWHLGNKEDEADPIQKKDFAIENKRDGKMKLGTNGRDKDVVIDKDGNVGIGKAAEEMMAGESMRGSTEESILNVLAAGSVGIGTANPESMLEIAGEVTIDPPAGDPVLTLNSGDVQKAQFAFESAVAALRLTSLNQISGYSGNYVSVGVGAAVVGGGGGGLAGPNRVTDNGGVVGGGVNNQAGDNAGSSGDCAYAFVGGGAGNAAGGSHSSVSGGGDNSASGAYSAVAGGESNSASDEHCATGGGQSNLAAGAASTVAGGRSNQAIGLATTVGGGQNNVAGGEHCNVTGGKNNHASGMMTTVAGGGTNVASGQHTAIGGGTGNSTTNLYSTVAGGAGNYSTAQGATVGGGGANGATGLWATVSGGESNQAGVGSATVGGGSHNMASGFASTVSGGAYNKAGGSYSFAAGWGATARDAAMVGGGDVNGDEGTFVWADSQNPVMTPFISTGPNQFLVRAAGGMGINKNDPVAGALDVAGNALFSGNVGVGTTLPDAKLTLNAGSTDDVNVLSVPEAAGGESMFSLRADYLLSAFNPNTKLRLRFDAGSQDVMTWNSAGNVGIGTTGPTQKLCVDPGGPGAIIVGGPVTNGGGRTSLILGVTAASNGYGYVQSVSAGGSSYGNLVLNHEWGNVGIGLQPTANRLEVQGDASKSTGGDWLTNSDARIKTDVQTVTNALDTLDKVRLVNFRYTDEYRAAHPTIEDRHYLNVIAQEFADVFPDHVKSSGEKLPGSDEEILQVDPYPLTIYSAAAVQELHRKVQRLDAEVADLHARLARLEAKDTRSAEQ